MFDHDHYAHDHDVYDDDDVHDGDDVHVFHWNDVHDYLEIFLFYLLHIFLKDLIQPL